MNNNSFLELVNPSHSPVIVVPQKYSFDEVAAALGLYIVLTMSEKDVEVYCPSEMTVGVNRLVGVQRIKKELGNKNLAITFKNYEATNIEKVSYDIVEGEFKLTIVPKPGLTAPGRDSLDANYTGVGSDLVILMGGTNDSDFPVLELPELANVKIVHLGTRALSTNKNIMQLATPASSVSEIVAQLISSNNLALDPDSSTNLVMGIESASSNFNSNDVTPETFETFAHLLRAGGVRWPKVVENFPQGAIPQQVQKAPPTSEVQASDQDNTGEAGEVMENPPADWLAQPKVYKGTSLN